MTPDQSLDAIKAAILAWMRQDEEASDVETIARVAELVEESGRPLIGKVERAANDEG